MSRKHRKAAAKRRRLAGPRKLSTAELLEAKQMLATDVLMQSPQGTVAHAVREIDIEFSAQLQGVSARDASNYALTYFGSDGIAGGGDDVAVPVLPRYADGAEMLRLSTLADLSEWNEVDYAFPPGIFGDWQIAADMSSVSQVANGGSTFFVSEDDYLGRNLVAQLEVTEDSDDDYVGVVFGLTVDETTGYPDSYYLLAWKKSDAGIAQGGLKLARVTDTGAMAERPDLWSLTDADRHIEILDEDTGRSWEPNHPYDVRVLQGSNGSVEVEVQDATTGDSLYNYSGVDSSPLGAGKFGFYNFSQANARYRSLNTTGSLPTGSYELRISATEAGLLDGNGELIDGDADGVPGGDYVGLFNIDIGVPTVAIDLQTASDTGVSASDELTNDQTPTFDIEANRSGVVQLFLGDEPLPTDSLVFADAGTQAWTSPSLADQTHLIRARFIPDLGNPVEESLALTVDALAPAILQGPFEAQAPAYQRNVTFTEEVDSETVAFVLIGPEGPIPTELSGSGTEYTVTFSPLVDPANYVLVAASTVADRAGNLISPLSISDTFELLADTSSPVVVDFSRTGLVKSAVEGFVVEFDEEVQLASFGPEDVTLTEAQGSILPEVLAVTPVGTEGRRFEITLESPIAFDGDFSVSIGPALADLSGNLLQEAFLAAFSIQLPLSIPSVPGDGVFIELYNGIGGGRAPLHSDLVGLTPDGTTLSPEIDFPRPGNVIQVGQSFTTFFSSTATPPDEVAALAARNFILDHQFYVAISDEMDLDPETPEIDLRFGVGSDDGFNLTIDDRFLGSAGDRSFSFSWFDLSVESAGLFPVSLLFSANASGQSGLEFWWSNGLSGGNQLVPQEYLYVTPILGEQSVTFEELPAGSVIADQFKDKGILFETVSGAPQVTNAFPGEFVPVSPANVFADPNDTPSEVGEFDLTFVVPGTDDAATTNFISFYLIDTEEIGATVTAFDPEGEVLYFEIVSEGGASQKQVTIQRDRIARVSITLGQGTDTAAIDSITFNTPETLNSRPVISEIADVTLDEGERLTFSVVATDPDSAEQLLTYTLAPGAPSGINLNQVTGEFSWIPGELDGPGVYPVTIVVRDNGSPRLRGEESFNVTVNESNQAPSLGAIAQETLTLEEPTLEFFANGTDPDRPVQTLTYRLLAGAPDWANIEEANGFFSATIDNTVADGVYPITVEVMDDGAGQLSATQTFNLVVDNNRADLVAAVIVPDVSEITPGTPFTLQWGVSNPGSEIAAGPWTERVYVSSNAEGANRQLLGSFVYGGVIAPGAEPVQRSEAITVPITSLNGDVYFLVEVDATNNVIETNESNLFASASTSSVTALLQFSVATAALTEGGTTTRATLTRNGDVSEPLVVAITPSVVTQLNLPETVTIPAGQYTRRFDIGAFDDEAFDGNISVTVTVSSEGYPTAATLITAIDNDEPTLTLTVASPEVAEGDLLRATIERDVAATSDILVNIFSSDDAHLDAPLAVLLPAGETSADFDLLAVNDTLVERNAIYTVSINAAGHLGDATAVTIPQNDVPALGLTIPGMLAEGSVGPTVLGTITRDAVTNRDLIVVLESSDNALVSVPTTVTIPAGEASVTFPIEVADDGDVNGDRSVEIVGRVRPTAGGAAFDEGAASDTVEVLDNDGETLTLSLQRDTVAEGRTITATVQRNTVDVTQPLLVTLTSDDLAELAAPATIEIPIGSQTVEFVLTGLQDDETDGDKVVTVTAEADGFNTGTGTVVVVDINLPDLVPTVPTPEKLTALTGETIDVGWRVENLGYAAAEGTWTQRVFVSSDNRVGGDTLVGQYTFTGPLGEGQGYDRSVPVRLPNAPGNYWIIVQTDVANTVLEGLESNNARVSATPITVTPSYTATVMTDVEMAPADTPVLITGNATNVADGEPAAFKEVSVHLVVRGTKRVFPAITDANGDFQLTFTPLPGEGGSYTIGAVFPGVSQAPVQDSFKLVGMRAEPPLDTIRVTEAADPKADSITFRNLADVPLTGLSLEVLGDVPNSIIVTAEIADDATVLTDMGTIAVNYSVAATDSSVLNGSFSLKVSSNEAPDVIVPIDYSVTLLVSRLVATPGRLSKSMLVGDQTSVEFTVENTGGKESGELTVLLPGGADWLTLATPANLPSLAPGATASITLLLTPPENLPLTAYNGSLVVRGDASQARLPFSFRAVSEETGDLEISVTDEFFFFTEEKPFVNSATVRLLDAITGTEVASSKDAERVAPAGAATVLAPPTVTIDSDGRIKFAGVAEGPYTLEVRSDDHETYRNTVRVEAGELNAEQVFISRNLVEYTWTVEEVEVEERTRITVDATFETNVPAPVVTVDGVIDLADLQVVGQSQQFDIKITNHGLIGADGVAIDFGDHPFYRFSPLISDIGILPAKSGITVPVIVERVADFDTLAAPALARLAGVGMAQASSMGMSALRLAAASAETVPCSVPATVTHCYICGELVCKTTTVPVINVEGNCPRPTVVPPRGGTPGSGEPGRNFSGPGGVAPVTIAPAIDFCAFCIEFDLGEYDASPLLKPAELAIEAYVQAQVPPLLGLFDVTLEAKASAQLCCDDGEQGFSLDGSVFGEVFVGKRDAGSIGGTTSITVAPGVTLDVTAEAKYDYELGVSANATGSITKECGDGLCGSVSVGVELSSNGSASLAGSARINAGSDADAVAAFLARFEGVDDRSVIFDVSGSIGLQGPSASATLGYDFCEDGLFGDLCFDGVFVDGAFNVTIFGQNVASGQLDALFGEDDEDSRYYILDPVCAFGEPEPPAAAFAAAGVLGARATSDQMVTLGVQYDYAGFTDQLVQEAVRRGAGQGVCATVGIQIEQEAVLTRTAFDASLELVNNSADTRLEGLAVNVVVFDTFGNDVTDLFAIGTPALSGLSGVDGSGELESLQTGSSSWLIVPRSEAAPSTATEYFVGGSMSYSLGTDRITTDFVPVSITVLPQAELELDYFLQRDVISDDPFTEEIEPAEAFALAVRVQNSGAGAASNFRIESAQPKIVENEKGLLIDFEITGTRVNGADVERTLTASFGDIQPGAVETAEWEMEATLQGLFTEYEVSFEYTSPLGEVETYDAEAPIGEDSLSLIRRITIHELIRSVNSDADAIPDFLVNDIADPQDLPDTLYLSTGDVVDVSPVVDRATDWGNVELGMMRLDIAPMLSEEGWSYLKINDPSDGEFELISVERSDGSSLPNENFWQTDRTFVGGGQRPVLEDKLHLLDFESTGSYTLVFSNGDLTGPEVTGFAGVTPNPTTQTIDVIDVVFSERLDDASFGQADISLLKNGQEVALTGLSIGLADNSTYRISGLAPLTADDAVYELIVEAGGVTDQVGNLGIGLATFRWVKGEAAPTVIEISGAPSGLVTAGVGSIDLVFSKEIVLSTLTTDDLSLKRGDVELIDNQVTIAQVGESTYRVSGLGRLTDADGDYKFQIDASGVEDAIGNAGLGDAVSSWTLDKTAPELLEVIDPATNPRNIVVQQIDIEFSEPIDLSTLDVGDLTLVRDGGVENLLAGDDRVTFESRGGNRYRIQGINWVQAFAGDPQVADFTLTVDGSGIADAAGNAGIGVAASTWTIDLDSPLAPTSLSLATFSGTVADGMLNSRNATLSGNLAEAGLTVVIEDLTTETELARASLSSSSFSLPIEFPSVGQHELRITLIDSAGNTTETTIGDLFVKDTPPVISSIVGVPSDFSRGPVNAIDVVFMDPIDPASLTKSALRVTRNGGSNLVNGTVSIVPQGDGRTYRFEGLAPITGQEGRYDLAFDFGTVANQMGVRNAGARSFIWLNDQTAPSSQIDTLEFRQALGSFVIDLSATDNNLSATIAGSGVAEYDLYYSDNGAPFELLETLPADSPTTTFVGEPNRLYYFRTVARDAAGNEENKPFQVDAWTYVPDLFAPQTQVDSVDTTDATLEVTFSGEDRGMGIESFDLFAQVDGGATRKVTTIAAGMADDTGLYSGSYDYQAISDGANHDYRFFTIATDFDGNTELPPESPADVVAQASFSPPAGTEVVDFDVQNGADQRSYVRYLDVVLNTGDQLGDILASLSDGSEANDRIRLTRYGIDGSGTGDAVGLGGRVSALDQALLFNFGDQGLGGNRNSSAGDGYYELELDLDGDGSLETQLGFYRLLGDVDGDGDADNADLAIVNAAFGQLGSNLDGDLNGDGRVNIFDRQLWFRGRGRSIADGLSLDD